ncbi:MAG: acyl-ACP--UDP-N-acetylglucosamine O-acyltransferase [Bacteroidales bacterium]|nr:acyl-ACP--UDP-N-acetylglucosamine O-acyltransferase [Bacteroidales bacterium]
MNISALASVHPDAVIGKDVIISPFVTIDKNVVIGDGTYIYPNAVILEGARIGKNCRIFPNAVISAIPQDLKFAGEETTAEIGDNTTVRECVTVNRGTASKGKTTIGNNCLLMAYSHVAHDCMLNNNIIIGNATQLAGEVEIDDFAILSGGVLVHQFCKIGKHIMLQGGSRTNKDIPPYIIAGRDPISYAGINVIGLRRRGFSNEEIGTIQEIYRIIYQSGLNNTQALDKVIKETPDSIVKNEIVTFLQSSARGIIKGYMD